MTLREMSADYRRQALALKQRIRQLRAQLREESDPDAAFRLRRRILDLEPLYRQAAELAELTAHYYERGYYRNEAYCI